MSTSTVTSYLSEHPRMIGVLFTATLLLGQAGSVAAGNNGAIPGP